MKVSRTILNNNRFRVWGPACSITAWSMIVGFHGAWPSFDGLSGPQGQGS